MNGYTHRPTEDIEQLIQAQTSDPYVRSHQRRDEDARIRSDFGLWDRPRRRCSVCGCPGGHLAGCPEGE